MGNPTRVYFIREAVFLSQPAQLEYWKGSDFGFSTLEEFANEASEKIRLLQPTTAEEMALLFSELGEFYNLQEFFDDIFTSSYTERVSSVITERVTGWEKRNQSGEAKGTGYVATSVL